MKDFRQTQTAMAVATALGVAAMSAANAGGGAASSQPDAAGTYVSGDCHNHTTCSDSSISMQKLIRKATDKNDTP